MVLLSLKSLLWLLGYCFLQRVYFGFWGTAFFEEFTLIVVVLLSSKSLLRLLGCLLACFLQRVALYAALSALASSKVYFACGVAWLVERWSLVSCFSVSINTLNIYE